MEKKIIFKKIEFNSEKIEFMVKYNAKCHMFKNFKYLEINNIQVFTLAIIKKENVDNNQF